MWLCLAINSLDSQILLPVQYLMGLFDSTAILSADRPRLARTPIPSRVIQRNMQAIANVVAPELLVR